MSHRPSIGRQRAVWRHRTRAALSALAAASMLGCYKPNIFDGGFQCDPGSKPCPDGFLCDPSTNTCRRHIGGAEEGGIGGAGGAGDGGDARDATDGTSDRTDAVDAACLMPRASCTPQTTCDPFCQTGCGCHEKCSVNTAGTLTCNAPVGTTPRTLGQSCDISSPGSGAQTDTCAPGLVCMADSCGYRCYQFCRGDNDCTSATCSRDAGGGKMVCDVPLTGCNPEAGRNNCALAAQGCYVSSVRPDSTLCDCPGAGQPVGQTCTEHRDCLPGLVCVDAFGNGDLRCRPVCTLATTCASCTTARSRAIGGSTLYGFCY